MVDSDGLEAVNVRIPDELLKIIDGLVEKGLFSSRAEAIREFLREYAIESANNTTSSRASSGKNGGGR